MMAITAKVFIVISSVLYGLSCLAKNKKMLFIVQIFSSALYCLHCFFVRAFVGAIVSVFDLIRIIIFYILEKMNGTQKQKIVTACILFVVALICSIFSWSGWYSILPFASTILFIVTLAISKLLLIKIATLFTASCSVIYLWLSGSTFGAISEMISVIFAIIGVVYTIIKMAKNKKTKTEN